MRHHTAGVLNERQSNLKYDVIIVGGGSAGCTLAARLSETPARSVLLLEAGPDYPTLEQTPDELKWAYYRSATDVSSPHNWAYTGRGTVTQTLPMKVDRGKVIGGSGAVNAQIFLRGLPEDYDDWAAQGNDEWSFLKVLSVFRQLETDLDIHDDFHGTDGPMPVRRLHRNHWHPLSDAFHQAALAAGFPEVVDMNHPDATGSGPLPMNNPDNIRMSAALAYLNPNRHRLNLTVKANAMTQRVLFEGNRAVGVEVASGGEIFTVEGREIVLCAGGIASPKLLLLSGIGPAHHLAELDIDVVVDLPGVGQNLRDHPIVYIELEAKPGVSLTGQLPPIHTGLRYTATGSRSRNDILIFPAVYDRAVAGSASCEALSLACTLELADSAGELTLVSSDPSLPPRLDYRYFATDWDRSRMREAIRLCVEFLEHPSFAPLVASRLAPTDSDLASDDALDAWMCQHVATNQHTSGTCKMGSNTDVMAVVDQYGRVHGTEALRVLDLSICPDVVRANTNATAIMIAERAAGWIP
jgi:choline dehydrogenase